MHVVIRDSGLAFGTGKGKKGCGVLVRRLVWACSADLGMVAEVWCVRSPGGQGICCSILSSSHDFSRSYITVNGYTCIARGMIIGLVQYLVCMSSGIA